MSFVRGFIPQHVEGVLVYLEELGLRLEQAFVEPYEILTSEPLASSPGLVVYADGVSWNPGSGEGLYRRSLARTWVFIG